MAVVATYTDDQPRRPSIQPLVDLVSGGMGEVKLARDQDIGRQVAIKRMLGEASPHSVARFVDEVRTVGRLEHPNIVPIHDVGVDTEGDERYTLRIRDLQTGEQFADEITGTAGGAFFDASGRLVASHTGEISRAELTRRMAEITEETP